MGNLKFYSQGLDDYAVAVTNQQTGFEKENMQDRRKDTSWKSSSTANQNIDFNKGITVQLNHFFLYHNLPNNAQVQPFKATQADYSDESQLASPTIISSANKPNLLLSWTAVSAPYWRIKITSLSSPAEIYLIFPGLTREITIMYNFGQLEEPFYDGSKIVESLGGIRAARQYHGGRERWEYNWERLDQANQDELQNLIADCRGKALPFFFSDIDGNYHYVRLMNPRIGARQVTHQQFNTDRLIFEEEL